MKTDIEIARSIELVKIKQVARETGIPVEHISNYGRYIAKVDKSQINCRYISSKVQEKYSESHQENRIYNHRLYEIKIQVFPEDEQKENFVVNGRHYYWMSISDMERDPNIVKKNLDVIDFVKESIHA